MPSPTSSTVPTERVSAPTSKASMADLMMLVMSWERRAMGGILLEGALGEPAPQPLQAASATPGGEAGELARHARQQVDPAATEEEQDEVEHGTADGGAHGDSDQLGPRGERDGRGGQDARQPLPPQRRGRRGRPA